jgi:hypothetical protein
MAMARRRADGRYEITGDGLARHSSEIVKAA